MSIGETTAGVWSLKRSLHVQDVEHLFADSLQMLWTCNDRFGVLTAHFGFANHCSGAGNMFREAAMQLS